MLIIESTYHYVTVQTNEKPSFVCKGICKSVHWRNKTAYIAEQLPKCDICGGGLKIAQPEIDYKIIKETTENLTWGLMRLSKVKPEFEEFAKQNWCR